MKFALLAVLVLHLFYALLLFNLSRRVHIFVLPEMPPRKERLSPSHLSTPVPAAGECSTLTAQAHRSATRSERGSIYQPSGAMVPRGSSSWDSRFFRHEVLAAASNTEALHLPRCRPAALSIFPRVEAREGHVSPRARLGVIARGAVATAHAS